MYQRLLLIIVILCGFTVSDVFARTNTTGYIFGQVRLESGGPPGLASVTIVDRKNGRERSALTREDGSFRFSALPIGAYSIQVESDGYASAQLDELWVNIGVGTLANATLLVLAEEDRLLEVVQVFASKMSSIDISSAESTTILTMDVIERLPVARNPTDVALLAPGTTLGDQGNTSGGGGFGNLVSFGGASVAENAFFINGMDVTNFRNGLGGSSAPFEFYEQFQVKTGGYGAEFGRSTGGVVNTVTKRGGDEWKFGTGAYYEPDSWRESSPDLEDPGAGVISFLDFLQYNSASELQILNLHAYGSGPLIRDRLYIYALVQQNSVKTFDDSGPSSFLGSDSFFTERADDDNTFWGLKLDWQINPDHLLEFTGFSDKVKTGKLQRAVNFNTLNLDLLGTGFTHRGGDNYILNYTGYFGQNLTLSAMVGYGKYDRTDNSDKDDIPNVLDFRINAPTFFPTDFINNNTGVSSDEREMYRLDGEWDLNEHLLRFGLDYQLNTSNDFVTYSGGVQWRYFSATPGDFFPFGIVPEGVTQVVRERFRRTEGGFEAENTAFYIEDHWQASDSLALYLGLRNETFDNKNAIGETFIKMDNQLAPRLGFSWDLHKDGSSKLFGTAGRYHLALPTVVNISLSGALTFSEEWFVLNGLNPDGSPDKGGSLGLFVVADGNIPNIDELVARDLEPSYQDEFILGYVFEPAPGWSLGFRGIYRDLRQVIEDVDLSRALNAWAAENGFEGVNLGLQDAYFLTNPGRDAHLRFDLDGDGTVEDIILSAADIGVPNVARTYKAAEIFFAKAWDEGWFVQGSYTYSKSRGNYEGWTRSDVNQSNAALTASFDFPELTEGAYGKLPNDRPHTIKLFAAWEFADKWELSGNFLLQSGRPYGALGFHPDLPITNVAFYKDGELVPRGSLGRTASQNKLDLGLKYTLPLRDGHGRLQLKLDVFNIFNNDTVTELIDLAERSDGPNPRHLLPASFQRPRSVRLSARIDF